MNRKQETHKSPTKTTKKGVRLEGPEDKQGRGHMLTEVIAIVLIVLIVRQYFFSPTVVQGTSMMPTLRPWDFLVENKWQRNNGTLERGMIVILDPPEGDGREFIKRVIGLPGDTVRIDRGVVYINGEAIDEPYTAGVATYVDGDFLELTVPPGSYFVMGDNRAYLQSNDSRRFGPVPEPSIKGIATFRYFPLGESFGAL